MNEYQRSSVIAKYIEGLLNEKRANGFSYSTEELILNRFDMYCIENNLETTAITREFLAEWMLRREEEGSYQQAKRISAVRQLLLYMTSYGLSEYIPSDFTHTEKILPHIFAPEELSEFFGVLDDYKPVNRPKYEFRLHEEYRLLFRVYLCCGVRNSEACGIKAEQVDLDHGVLTILGSKGDKDRLVYMPEDLSEDCRQYHSWLIGCLGYEPEWFFPGRKPERPLSNSDVAAVFNRFWKKTRYADCNNKPTVHDFRFTFVVNRINAWAEEQVDLKVMMPYLQRYLGHKTEDNTMYYYYLVQDAYKTVQKKDSMAAVIPEVKGEEYPV